MREHWAQGETLHGGHGEIFFIVLKILQGDVLSTLAQIPDGSVRCVCTSPPYFNLRSYLRPDDPQKRFEIGSEQTPAEYISKMVEVFAAVRRVLADDGTVWLNLGDSSVGSRKGSGDVCSSNKSNGASRGSGRTRLANGRGDQPAILREKVEATLPLTRAHDGFKAKDIMGMPWRVAFALQADGWFLRSAIPWLKRNVMPESVNDRPTHAVEYIFLLSKCADYYYDKSEVMGSAATEPGNGIKNNSSMASALACRVPSRNRRNSDWFMESWQGLLGDEDRDPLAFVVNPQGYKEAHFATWPERLVRPMILAGSAPGDTVVDIFAGSGTTGKVALELGRKAILCELNGDYIPLIRRRCETTVGLAL